MDAGGGVNGVGETVRSLCAWPACAYVRFNQVPSETESGEKF